MAPSPVIDDRRLRVVAHPGRTHEVPAANPDRSKPVDLDRAGRLHHLTAPRESVVQHAPAVLTHGVVDLGRGNPVRVDNVQVQRDRVVLFRQVFAGDTDLQTALVQGAENAVMLAPPWQPPTG